MKLLNICSIGGSSVSKFDGVKKYIATGDIINNEITSFEYVDFNSKPSRANVEIKENDVLFAKMMDTVKVLKANDENTKNIYSTGFYCITPNSDVLQDYLYLFFNSNTFNLQKNKNCSGATQKAINNDGLKKIEIKQIPPKEIQKIIVKKLNAIDKLIKIKNLEIDKLNQLIKSQFAEMFENEKYEKIELKTIAKIGSSKRIYANEYRETGVPFYRSKEIRELGLGMKPSVELFIDREKYDFVKEKYGVPKKGDILLAAIGATIGYMWIVDDSSFYYKDGNLINVSPYNNINSIYLRYILEKIISDFKSKNASGSAQLAMTIEKIEKFLVPVPPIELQNKFANIVEQIDKQKFEFETSLKKLEELQASLMQEYFG